MQTGFFVTFEGGDGAGKTTLIDKIEEALFKQSIPYLRTREPGGSSLGEELRNLLLHASHPLAPYAELGLFLAARAQHVHEKIKPALQSGKVVLCDRFNDSTIAYQGVGRHLGKQKVQELCEFFCQGVLPNLTFYLDLDPAQGIERVKQQSRAQDRMEVESLAYHKTVRQAFLELASQDSNRIKILNASKSPEAVFQEAYTLLQAAIS